MEKFAIKFSMGFFYCSHLPFSLFDLPDNSANDSFSLIWSLGGVCVCDFSYEPFATFVFPHYE